MENKYKYIPLVENSNRLINLIDQNLNKIEVKGESVQFLFNARMLFKEFLEGSIEHDKIVEIIKEDLDKGIKKEDIVKNE